MERRAVSWTKGCYLGQEAVCMQDMRGKVKRRLVTLAAEGAEPGVGTAVHDEPNGKAVGEVTSVARDPTTGGWVAIARVGADFSARGTRLSLLDDFAVVVESPPRA
jgi:hypothetical protein